MSGGPTRETGLGVIPEFLIFQAAILRPNSAVSLRSQGLQYGVLVHSPSQFCCPGTDIHNWTFNLEIDHLHTPSSFSNSILLLAAPIRLAVP
jgi:hypothetical protein